METTNKDSFKWILIATAIMAFTTVVMAFFPQAILLVPVTVTIVWLKWRGVHALIPLAVFLAGVYFLYFAFGLAISGQASVAHNAAIALTVLAVCLTLPVTLLAVIVHRGKMRMYDGVIRTILGALAGVAAAVAFTYVYFSQSVPDLLIDLIRQVLTQFPAETELFYTLLTQANSAVQGIDVANKAATLTDQVTYIVQLFEEALPISLGSTALSYAIFGGFVTYYVPHMFLKNKGVDLVKTPAFKDLRIPRPEWFVLLVLYILTALFRSTDNYQLAMVVGIVQPALRLVFTVQGVAFLIFLHKSKRISLGFAIGFIAVGVLIGITFWLGLFESGFNLRARMKEEQENRSL